MTDQVRELISAMMDGELSEIEMHRLLRQIESEPGVGQAWAAYHETREVIRRRVRGDDTPRISMSQHLVLSSRISGAIADSEFEAAVDSPGLASGSAKPASMNKSVVAFYKKSAAGLAIAASLAVAVIVGFQVTEEPATETLAASPESSVATSAVPVQLVARQPGVQQPYSQQYSQQSRISSQQIASDGETDHGLRELDAEGQRRLRELLNQHDRMARMRPNTQLVTFPASGPRVVPQATVPNH